MKDSFGRTVDYLRISVTDRCNLACTYCMPPRGTRPVADEDILTNRQIVAVVKIAAQLGFKKIRLTGGEPLLRPDIVGLVGQIAGVPDVEDLSMTTNGTRLESLAYPLAEAGLQRVNVSLDSVNPERYTAITRSGDVDTVLAGLTAARAAGLSPIKINCVVERSAEEPDAQGVARFARESGYEVRFIRRMNLARGEFWVVDGGNGGDCPHCNRLRLTCDGKFKPCLFSDLAFSIPDHGVEGAIREALAHKPESGRVCHEAEFCTVGG